MEPNSNGLWATVNPNVDGDPRAEQCALAGIAQGDPQSLGSFHPTVVEDRDQDGLVGLTAANVKVPAVAR